MLRARLFDPGLFTARLDLESPVETADGQGGVTLSHALESRHWARIEPVASGAGELGHVLRDQTSHTIWVRRASGIVAGRRFRKGARLFVIVSVHDPDETGRYLVCACREDKP